MITALGVSLVIGWIVFSFLFWRALRSVGVDEERIFDLTFYSTLVGFFVARLFFVILHWDMFSDAGLKIVAIWVAPGLSFYAGLVGVIATLVYLGRLYKIRVGLVLDALGVSLPLPMIVGELGSFLSAAEVGKKALLPWAISYPGHEGTRHPVQLYAGISLAFIALIMGIIQKRAFVKKWPYGIVGVLFFLLFSIVMFTIELAKESGVYWVVTANQWILIGFFGESIGALYVRGGGREQMRPFLRRIGGAMYAAISKRGTRRSTPSS